MREDDNGKLIVPDEQTHREVMRLWRQVVELDRKRHEEKPPRSGKGPAR